MPSAVVVQIAHHSVFSAVGHGSEVIGRRNAEARFHELLLNMAPNSATIQQNVDRALNLSDRSVYDYWSDLSEQGFYQRLVQANITQQMVVDSVVVDLSGYPYEARCYAHQYMIRESNITAYEFESSCRRIDTERPPVNPHGMMI